MLLQNETSGVKADPEMERLEKQVQQSVDTLSTLLVEQEKKAEEMGDGGEDQKDGEAEGVEDDEDSLSDGEDDQSEPEDEAHPHKKPPGSVQILPSISDQMSLLSPGSVQPASRELSPEALLEESLYSISKPIPTASSVGKTAQVNDNDAQLVSTSTASRPGRISSTTSSPGPDTHQVETQRPRSHSLDTHCGRTSRVADKPLMIPSNAPPWIEMASTHT